MTERIRGRDFFNLTSRSNKGNADEDGLDDLSKPLNEGHSRSSISTKQMASMTPDFWNKIMFWKRNKNSVQDVTNDLTRWEWTLNEIRKIITWDNPADSFLCLLGVNVLFWLLVYIQVKFYGVIFIALLALSINELWNQYFHSKATIADADSGRESVPSTSSSTSSQSRFSSANEINGCFNDSIEMMKTACLKLKRFRQEQPGAFCIATCISFLMLSFIGRTISGGALLYILLMAIMIVPGTIIHLLPSHFLRSFVQFIYSSHKETESDKEDEDYLPDTNKENLELLRLASDLQLSFKEDEESTKDYLLEQLSARTSDTTESSFGKLSLLPESAMPSIESSLDFLDLDLDPEKNAAGKKEDSDSSDGSDINFQSKHFNGDSSEEEDFSNGLKFNREKEDKPDVKESVQGLFSAASIGLNLLSTGASILSSAIKSPPVPDTSRQERESSSDTDSFELITEEDI